MRHFPSLAAEGLQELECTAVNSQRTLDKLSIGLLTLSELIRGYKKPLDEGMRDGIAEILDGFSDRAAKEWEEGLTFGEGGSFATKGYEEALQAVVRAPVKLNPVCAALIAQQAETEASQALAAGSL